LPSTFLYTKVKPFRDAINDIGHFFKSTVFGPAIDYIKEHWQGLLQVFLLINPFTLVIGVFVQLYLHVAIFRDVVNGLVQFLRTDLLVVINLVIDHWRGLLQIFLIVFPVTTALGVFWAFHDQIMTIFTTVGQAGLILWHNLELAFHGMLVAWSDAWVGARIVYATVILPVYQAVDAGAHGLANVLAGEYHFMGVVWSDLWVGARLVFNTVLVPMYQALDAMSHGLYNTLSFLYHLTWVAWSDLWNASRAVYDGTVHPMLDAMSDAFHRVFDGIYRAAGGLRDGLRDVFRDIANVIAAPVHWVVHNVWDNGIVKLFNDAAGAFGLKDHIGTFETFDHYATGGVIPGEKSKGDWIPFYGSAGEGILSLKDMQALGGESGFNEFRALLHGNRDEGSSQGTGRGNSHFADGGLLPHYGIGGVLGKIGAGVLNQMPGLQGLVPGLSAAKDFFPGVIEASARAMLAPVMAAADHMLGGNNTVHHILKAVPHKVEDMLMSWLHHKDEEAGVGPNGKKAMDFLHAQAGKPYVWGAAGPGGYDCSGLVSAIYNVLIGTSPYNHTFSTGDIGDRHFPGGPGAFTIGWSGTGGKGAGDDAGHMAGVLMGTKFESRGGRGVIVGNDAVDATHAFDHVAHVQLGLGGIGGAIAGMFSGMGHLNDVQVAQLMVAAGFPKSEIPTGVAVVIAESDENPLDTNHNTDGSNDLGLWQINDRYNAQDLALGDWRNPGINTAMAHQAWARRGWKDWSTYSYWHTTDQYLGRGRAAQAAIHDNGGYMMPGELGINKTKTPEPVFTSNQWQDISKLAAGNGGDVHVKVYVGDREITDIVRTEVDKGHDDLANLLNSGRKV
jgi:hypothetical protein